VRDLVRAREDARADLMRVRTEYPNCFSGRGSSIRADTPGPVSMSCGCAGNGSTTPTKRRRLTTISTRCSARPRCGIASMSRSRRWPPHPGSPTRWIGWVVCAASPALTGLALTVAIGDWSRFTGSSIGAYVGLVPCEYSSGASRVHGSITKAGNTHVRRLLIEAGLASPHVLPHPGTHDADPLGAGRSPAAGPRGLR
jgi:hypothetical protein